MIVSEKSNSKKTIEIGRWVIFIFIALIINLPIIATILTSFKTTAAINSSPPTFFFTPTLENYLEVLYKGNTNLPRYIINSTIIAGGGSILAIFLSFFDTFYAAFFWARGNGSCWRNYNGKIFWK